jgi:hypothetical protein
VTEDPITDLFAIALTCRRAAHANPHLYDLMLGLPTRATYRPVSQPEVRLSGRSPAFRRPGTSGFRDPVCATRIALRSLARRILELIRGDVFFWQSLQAAAILVAVPIAFVFNLFLDRFISGFTMGAGQGLTGAAGRPTRVETKAATRHRQAAPTQARVYWPVVSRMTPAPTETMAAPIWWAANTQPNTTDPASPNASRHSAAVGGTVATQSRP